MTDQSPPVVYVVCQDEYEDNGPCAVFTDREIAEQHAEALADTGGAEFEVRPMPLLDHLPTKVMAFMHHGNVRHDDGTVEDERASSYETWEYHVPADPSVHVGLRRLGKTNVHVSAVTPEAAESAFRGAVEEVRQR